MARKSRKQKINPGIEVDSESTQRAKTRKKWEERKKKEDERPDEKKKKNEEKQFEY